MSKVTAYSAINESIKLSIILGVLCLTLILGDWLWRWDRLIYDVQASLINHEADDEIVIIAIDEASLKQIGRWPWPRNIHAKLVNQLSELGAKAVFIDVIFAEPSIETDNDQALAQAIYENGKVLLPVLLEQSRLQGQLLETLPLPALTQSANTLGHVHVELDPDGIARGTYLYEGLGEARWPHIGLALWQMLEPGIYKSDTQSITPDSEMSPWRWVRKDHFLIPYVGPPGSFNTISFVNVYNNQVLIDSLKGKIVLIGVTASGLGDSLPTPVSGLTHPMSGIEINANIIQAIKSNTLIHSINNSLHIFISIILVIIPVLAFPYLSPRASLYLIIAEISCIFFITSLVLHMFHIWIPLSSTVVCLLISYPLWAWRRLEFTVKYLNSELEILSKETNELQKFVAHDEAQPFELLQSLVPATGLAIYNEKHQLIVKYKNCCNSVPDEISSINWINFYETCHTTNLALGNDTYILCINWNAPTPPNEQQTKIIKTYSRQIIKSRFNTPKSTSEIIELRVQQIQKTTDKMAYLRHFISDSLEQMADGIIVINSLGVVTLANKQASEYLNINNINKLLSKSIIPLLNSVKVTNGEDWETIIKQVLSNKEYNNIQVRSLDNKDLVVNIKALHAQKGSLIGFIINLSDISKIKHAQKKHGEMLSFLSHDLRSPLVSILAMLENTDNYNDPELTNRIRKNINHTIELAEDFIHLSRVEGDEPIKFTDINLSDVIANAIDILWDQAIKKHIRINEHSHDPVWIHANGAIMERVIVNILGNAIKYNHIQGTIDITIERKASTVICCIKDDGPGIAEQELNNIFDRFNRTPRPNGSGIGLGLTFVNAAITRHHGSVTVTSGSNKGTCFCISLPTDKS